MVPVLIHSRAQDPTTRQTETEADFSLIASKSLLEIFLEIYLTKGLSNSLTVSKRA